MYLEHQSNTCRPRLRSGRAGKVRTASGQGRTVVIQVRHTSRFVTLVGVDVADPEGAARVKRVPEELLPVPEFGCGSDLRGMQLGGDNRRVEGVSLARLSPQHTVRHPRDCCPPLLRPRRPWGTARLA